MSTWGRMRMHVYRVRVGEHKIVDWGIGPGVIREVIRADRNMITVLKHGSVPASQATNCSCRTAVL